MEIKTQSESKTQNKFLSSILDRFLGNALCDDISFTKDEHKTISIT